ncbi:hypothetical protein LINPERHAP1_LOCUS11886 [Linum perenne]
MKTQSTNPSHFLLLLFIIVVGNQLIKIGVDASEAPKQLCRNGGYSMRGDCFKSRCYGGCLGRFGRDASGQCDSVALWFCNCYLPC